MIFALHWEVFSWICWCPKELILPPAMSPLHQRLIFPLSLSWKIIKRLCANFGVQQNLWAKWSTTMNLLSVVLHFHEQHMKSATICPAMFIGLSVRLSVCLRTSTGTIWDPQTIPTSFQLTSSTGIFLPTEHVVISLLLLTKMAVKGKKKWPTHKLFANCQALWLRKEQDLSIIFGTYKLNSGNCSPFLCVVCNQF